MTNPKVYTRNDDHLRETWLAHRFGLPNIHGEAKCKCGFVAHSEDEEVEHFVKEATG